MLLMVVDPVLEMRHSDEDPERIEKKRIELETIEKGEHRPGVGWVWNDRFVPEGPSTAPYFERRNRIIRNGAWNPARKGWEYQDEFFGVWD
jgi:hypothetical protein